jgi:hypothetical protein
MGARNLFLGILGIGQNVERERNKMEEITASIHRSIFFIKFCPLLE